MDRDQEDSRLVLEKALHNESVEPSRVALSLLEDITGNFSEDAKIGRGAFATVYKVCIVCTQRMECVTPS
jgi:hypothetical protein